MAVRDVILTAILVFGFGTAFFVVNYVMGETVDKMTAVPTINESNATVETLQSIDIVTGRLDYVVFGLFIALVLALIITGWFVGGNPIFAFIYFLVVVITVVISTILANVWETISGASVFGVSVNAFPITNHLLLNLPLYMAVIGFIGIVVMFAKPQVQQ